MMRRTRKIRGRKEKDYVKEERKRIMLRKKEKYRMRRRNDERGTENERIK